MPSDADVETLRLFIDDTVSTYRLVIEVGGVLRPRERDALLGAIVEFAELHPERIVSQYAELDDADIADSGLYGQQLRGKREVARYAANDVEGKPNVAERRRFSRANVRRWLKRAKVLAGTLKALVPGGEALVELLDLLDGALDPPR